MTFVAWAGLYCGLSGIGALALGYVLGRLSREAEVAEAWEHAADGWDEGYRRHEAEHEQSIGTRYLAATRAAERGAVGRCR